jgi:hypothetical protein
MPRLTIRRMMDAVIVIAVLLWLASAAWRVYRNPADNITHIFQDRATGELTMSGHSIPASFWPQYLNALLGRPWPEVYPCDCRTNPEPARRELASAADANSLLPLFNRICIPYEKAVEHRLAMESLGAAVAFDEKRIADSVREEQEAAVRGEVIGGAEDVRRALRDGVAVNRKSFEKHKRLFELYDSAARSPTLMTDPPVVESE